MKLLSIVIPIYNESKTLRQQIHRVLSVNFPIHIELILVDDGSTDDSFIIMKELELEYPDIIRVYKNKQNSGKTQTVKHGIQKTEGDVVVIQDADLEYNPENLLQFIPYFQNDSADVVYGNRFGKNNSVVYWQNWLGNRGLSFFSSLFTGIRAGMWTADMEVCYKMARGEMFRTVGSTISSTSRFGLEPEITAKFSKYRISTNKIRFAQVPIDYEPRTIAEGKKMNAIVDGIKALWEIVYFNVFDGTRFKTK